MGEFHICQYFMLSGFAITTIMRIISYILDISSDRWPSVGDSSIQWWLPHSQLQLERHHFYV